MGMALGKGAWRGAMLKQSKGNTSNTVFELPSFNLAFTSNRCQIVMDLQCRHQPLDHLEEEYQAVCLPSVSERWKM